MVTPDGMGADRHRERMNIINSKEEPPEPPYTLIAVDEDGEEVYEAESAWSDKEIRHMWEMANARLEEDPENFDDAVASFKIKE